MKQLTQHTATAGHLGDHVAILLAKADKLCHAVAGSDLGTAPLYVVPQSSLPVAFGTGDHCYGYTTPRLDLYLQDHIPDWRGRGPCMVVNDVALREDHFEEDLDCLICVNVLHELAHVLDRPALFADREGTDPARITFEKLVVAYATRRPSCADLPAYFGHDHSFIRIVLHLCHRAERHGVAIAPSVICGGYRYGLSHASRYQEALGDEPARRESMPIRKILATKPPIAFSSLWCDDFIAYHKRFPLSEGAKP